MSMYESAKKINDDLTQLFGSTNVENFTIEQRERILNILIRFGGVAKFRCRSNSAYDNFVNACFNNIATTERVKFDDDSKFSILQVKKYNLVEKVVKENE